jgi:hypothetical protein
MAPVDDNGWIAILDVAQRLVQVRDLIDEAYLPAGVWHLE